MRHNDPISLTGFHHHQMPYFEDNPLSELALHAGEADREIDLCGLTNEEALRRIETLLADSEHSGSALIRFDPASGDGRETLFLPLGRRLLAARRDGLLKRCLPVQSGDAYFVEFAAG